MSTATEEKNISTAEIESMFAAGAHYALVKARRHPTTRPFIYGAKNNVEIFDLEKTAAALEDAKQFVRELAMRGKKLLFVSSKPEAHTIIVNAAESINQPYVASRWVGGTLTNFPQIRKRVTKLDDLKKQEEKGELAAKYTKREQLMISREVEGLEEKFGGIVDMKEFPGALFVIDPRRESIAVAEAEKKGIPVVALANSDCDLSKVDYAVPGNDVSRNSIAYFVGQIAAAYQEGQKGAANKS